MAPRTEEGSDLSQPRGADPRSPGPAWRLRDPGPLRLGCPFLHPQGTVTLAGATIQGTGLSELAPEVASTFPPIPENKDNND